MICLIDNYDSFTHNLYQSLGQLGEVVKVIRNDVCAVQDVMAHHPRGIVISPGPCTPNDAGMTLDLVQACLESETPLLGICLGHQAIGQVLGGTIVQTEPMHGKVSYLGHDGTGLFDGLPSPLCVARYHSLMIDPRTCPQSLNVTAQSDDGIIMAIQHKTKPVYGVQFHPESISTPDGQALLKNFVDTL